MRDLNEVLDLTLNLPVGGKTYTVHPPSAAVGASLVDRLAFGIAADAGYDLDPDARGMVTVDDDDLPDFARQCLGDTVYQQMVDDGLSQAQLTFCVTTAFLAWTVGKAYATLYWETAGAPGKAPTRDQHPTATPTRGAEASTTPSSASPSGTKPPTTEPPAGAPSSSSGGPAGT